MHVLYRSAMGNPPKVTEGLQAVLRAMNRLGGELKPPWCQADKILFDNNMGGVLDRERRDNYDKLQTEIDNHSQVSCNQ